MIESQHLCPSRAEVLNHVQTGSVFWLCWRYLLSHWWEKDDVCFLRGSEEQRHHHRQCQPHCRHNLRHPPTITLILIVLNILINAEKKISPSCGTKKIGKWAGWAAMVPLSKVPRAACALWHLSLSDDTCSPCVHVLMWCGCKTSHFSFGINDVCFCFFFFYQPYHPHHPQHPHYLVNPLHPHQILLLLLPLPFIILQPSKVIRTKCWSPGDHSLSHQEQAQMLYEHVETHVWHTLPLHTTEPRYESCWGE